ncbi:MAG: adenine deaminase [Bacteroidota bacterium]|nr:adenine deaminase [Bacteroidota bacterium]
MNFQIKGNVVDLRQKEIFFGTLHVEEGRISSIEREGPQREGVDFLLPGFVDAHVHIESSMLVPAEFAKLAVVHGTVATVSDPHEIANVCGMEGVDFMIANGKEVPFKFYFGAPSCVPATGFETAGASLGPEEVEALLARKEIHYLSEMMNFPGVLAEDPEVMAKLQAAKKLGKPIDGHAPGLRGEDAKKYVQAGISTDHECFTREEALEKLGYGMKILIREGSAAKNFEALIDLLPDHGDEMMFCSDDKHPDSLVKGHINQLCARAVARGIDVFKVLKAACMNPVLHYQMQVGLLSVGDPADFITVRDLEDFVVTATFIDGNRVAENGKSEITTTQATRINHFQCAIKKTQDFQFESLDPEKVQAIEALDGQLITNRLWVTPSVQGGHYQSDPENDLLKMVVINRYHDAPVARALVKNFGLKRGAIASSVAHDSHNIIAVGVDDDSLCRAVNLVIENLGGVSAADHLTPKEERVLPLPVGGLMSDQDGYRVAELYTAIDQLAKSFGSGLSAPFMTLSFMALLVIPHIKLSDLGLFDGDRFEFVR